MLVEVPGELRGEGVRGGALEQLVVCVEVLGPGELRDEEVLESELCAGVPL